MGILMEKDNSTSIVEIITSVSLRETKRKAGVFTNGLERTRILIKVNLREVRGMEGEYFGGVTEVVTRVTLRMVCSQVSEFFLDKTTNESIRGIGPMVCSMDRVRNTLKMAKGLRGHSDRTSSTERASSTSWIRSFTEFGRTMSSTWST